VIHNIRGADEQTILHIEVLAQERDGPAARINHLAAHMAITVDALRSSVRKPLMRGAVYPESFEEAFASWKKQRQAMICTTDIDRCLQGRW
jgi:hypothetical protein